MRNTLLRVTGVFAILFALVFAPTTSSARVATCGGLNVTINGTAGADTIFGTSGPDVINGQGGDDSIFGGSGLDTICGAAGNDTINGNAGNDSIWGGVGNDSIQGEDGVDTLHGGPNDDFFDDGNGLDTINGDAGADQGWPCNLDGATDHWNLERTVITALNQPQPCIGLWFPLV